METTPTQLSLVWCYWCLCRALCRECNAKEKALGMGKYVCHKCQ